MKKNTVFAVLYACFVLAYLATGQLVYAETSAQTWIPSWRSTSQLNEIRSGAAVIEANGYIYLLGGVDGNNFLKTTEYTKINADGSLGPWQVGTSLNEERGFFEGVEHQGYLYVVGGGKGAYGQTLLKTVERAKILTDGSLGEWQTEKNSMLVPRRCSKVIKAGDIIYTFGGFGGAMLNSVERARINADGHLEPWVMEPGNMTMPRYIHGVKQMGDIVYVLGGHDQDRGTGQVDVEWARIKKEGGLEPWQRGTPMQVGRWGLSDVAHDGWIYAMGGLSGLEYLDSIERAKPDPKTGIQKWESIGALASPRGHFSVLVYKDWIYVFSGTNAQGYTKSVEYAQFNAKGEIGYWGNPQESKAYADALEAKKNRKDAALPFRGTVAEVLQTDGYTYVQLKDAQGSWWIAGPKVELKVGMQVSHSDGVVMPNYRSKVLQRNFDAVRFVGQIKQIKIANEPVPAAPAEKQSP